MPARLVHISDLHFAEGANRLPSPLQTLKLVDAIKALGASGNWFRSASHSTRAAKALSRYFSRSIYPKFRPGAVLVTGDLATTGASSDLRAARAYLFPGITATGWVDRVEQPIFSAGSARVDILPGNHDRYLGLTLLPGNRTFEEAFVGLWSTTGSTGRVSTERFVGVGDERVAIIAADFTFRNVLEAFGGPIDFVGQGLVHADVLHEMVQLTQIVSRRDRCPVVWAIHYPPSYPGCDRNLRLREEEVLVSAAEEAGVQLIFAGHTHEPKNYYVGRVLVSCVGSAMQADEARKWHFNMVDMRASAGRLTGVTFTPFHYQSHGKNNFVRGADDVHEL